MNKLTRTKLNYWRAFLKIHPAGEELADARHATIRHDLYTLFDTLQYTICASAGANGYQKPRPKDLQTYQIVNRYGVNRQQKKTYLDMTPEEISADIRRMGMAGVKKGNKWRKV